MKPQVPINLNLVGATWRFCDGQQSSTLATMFFDHRASLSSRSPANLDSLSCFSTRMSAASLRQPHPA